MKLISLLAASVLALGVATAHAGEKFSALEGIQAEALSQNEMETVQGKFDMGSLVPCVSEVCGGAGGWRGGFLPQPPSDVLRDIFFLNPDLYPNFPSAQPWLTGEQSFWNAVNLADPYLASWIIFGGF